MNYKYNEIVEENLRLEKENDELRERIEKEKENEDKDNIIKDEELEKIKKECDDRKEELKIKDKKYREMKRGYKNSKDKVKMMTQQIKEMENLIQILNDEYNNKHNCNNKEIDTNIHSNELDLLKEENEKLSQSIIKVNNDIEVRENIYSSLCEEYAKINKEIYIFNQKIITTNDIIVKNKEKTEKIESYILSLKSKFENSKSLYNSLESSITTKLYFIRFSNSLVRSFFNIINTRRIQIEMLRSFPSSSLQSLNSLFSQLNHYQSSLIQNYYDFLSLLESSSNI